MSGLAKFIPRHALVTPSASVSAPSSQTTEGIEWKGGTLSFDELPAEARRLAPDAGVLAETVIAVSGIRTTGGVARQTRIAFRSYATHVIVLTVARTLVKRPDGRYAGNGPWLVSEHTVLKTASGSPAKRSSSSVKPGRLTDGADGGTATGASVSRELESGGTAEVYLPEEIRRSLAKTVPRPTTTHCGQLLRWAAGPRTPAEQTVTLLRADGRSAVVVLASRPDDASAPWAITRWVYDLLPASRMLVS